MTTPLRKIARLSRAAVRVPVQAVKGRHIVRARYFGSQSVPESFPYELHLHERFWERRMPAKTGGWQPIDLDDGMLYEGAPYLILYEIMRRLKLGSSDVFVDLGCGKGRAVWMAARTGCGKVVGIEQDAGFLADARKNLEALADRGAKVELRHGLAQVYDFDDTTVLYLFNPFGARTLSQVLVLLRASLDRRPRPLRIVYANPVHEAELSACGWLENDETWADTAFPEHTFQPPNPRMVSFWRTI